MKSVVADPGRNDWEERFAAQTAFCRDRQSTSSMCAASPATAAQA